MEKKKSTAEISGGFERQMSLPVRMHKNAFAFCIEFERTGEGEIPAPTTQETRRNIPANGVRMFCRLNEENMKKADPEKYFVIADYWLGTDRTPGNVKRVAEEGISLRRLQDEEVAVLRSAMKAHGERVWWSICGEQDTGAKWPRRMFKSKKEAYDWLRDCYLTNKTGRYSSNRKMANFPLMKNRYKIDFQKENIAIHVAMCIDTHYAFEWGARLVWMERNCWLANNQVGTAFVRGAGSQYGGYWGLDFSPWGEPTFDLTKYDKKGHRAGGLSENLHLREWVAGFYSGANMILAEASFAGAWIDGGSGKWKLSPYGENAKRFGTHALIKHPERGTPHVPVALMLEHNHGWDPRDHRIWGGRVPYTRAEQMLDNFFNLAFPGQEDGFYTSKWMSDGSFQFPWHDVEGFNVHKTGIKPSDCPAGIIDRQRKCLLKLLSEGFDTRPYEKGMLASSQWGDSFDVVLENCPIEVLCKYKIVILLGAVRLTGKLEEKLRKYTEQGGEVIINVTQVSRENEEFLGVRLHSKIQSVCIFYPGWNRENAYNEISDIESFSVASRNVDVIETAKVEQSRQPTLIKRTIGKGAVYFCGVPYMQGADSKPMAEHCKDFLNWVISRHLLVKTSPDIQYMVNTTESGIIVTLINNYGKDWSGEIVPSEKGLALKKGVDIWNNKTIPAANFKKGMLKTDCAAFGFRILKLDT